MECIGCEYNGICYSRGDEHPSEPCVTCILQNGYRWVAPACCIDGVPYDVNETNPDNECELCYLAYARDAWKPNWVGWPCPDGTCDSLGNCN